MSIAAFSDFEYEAGRTAARRTLAEDIFKWGIARAVMRASSYIAIVMDRTRGDVDDSGAGVLFEFNRFLYRHAAVPVFELDVIDRDAGVVLVPAIDADTPIELSGAARRKPRSPKNREGA